jgi:uncharacterized protein YndB with AHSA1/START domain
MSASISIPPVRKTIRVAAERERAFDVFTAGLGRWWPRTHGIGPSPMRDAILEGRVGGRWYELGEDGTKSPVGTVLVWEPPQRVVIGWQISSQWQYEPDPDRMSEVEVRFVPDGPGATRVELEHRHFERMAGDGGASMRKDVDSGWPGLLDLYAKEVATRDRG